MKILLTTHGKLASGLMETLDMFAGNADNITTLELGDEGIDEFNSRLEQIFAEDDQWLCLCDLKGGSPFKSCCIYKITNPQKNINIITGVNFPMLLEATLLSNNLPPEELINSLIDTGKSSIELIEIKE